MKTSERQRAYAHQYYQQHREYYRQLNRQWHDAHRERAQFLNRRWAVQQKWDLTPEAYEAMLVAQNGRCAMCGALPKRYRLAIDHNHQTGQIRGLLCIHCNWWLGGFEGEKVEQAQAYLDRFR
jgi:hypothetical protein